MPLPITARNLTDEAQTVNTNLTNISAAIAALPNPPLEADLPDIIQIVADLNSAAQIMQGIVDQVLVVLSTTRIGSQ